MSAFCLIDFEDSFTYNIVSIFAKQGIDIDLYHWSQLNEALVNKYHFFIFGPGPGHIDDYKEIYKWLEKILMAKDKFSLGICLGHQLILKVQGANIIPWPEPLHGRSLEIELPVWLGKGRETVQFYNSWGVDPQTGLQNIRFHIEGEKVLAAVSDNFYSYQFHPESVGTSCPDTFFDPIFQFYYNSKDGLSFQNRRHLR